MEFAFSFLCGVSLFIFMFEKPQEENRKDQEKVEKIWRNPDVVNAGYRGKKKGQNKEKRKKGFVCDGKISVSHKQNKQ